MGWKSLALAVTGGYVTCWLIFNGWNRWHLIQLRCAFTGEMPAWKLVFDQVENQKSHRQAVRDWMIDGRGERR